MERKTAEYIRVAIGFAIAVMFGTFVKYTYAPQKGSFAYYGFVYGGGIAVFILMHVILGRFPSRGR